MEKRKTVIRLVERNELLNLRILGAAVAETIKNSGGIKL